MYNDKKATYEYDEANNLIKEVSEYGLTESYEYDGDGNMTSLTKNDGTTIEYTYDSLGRKLSEGSRTFSYDAYDNLTEASYNDKTISYTYDKYNNITKVDDANNNIIEYKWDIYGNKTELKYKDYTISYTYNQFDKINKILKNNEDYAAYTYDSRGNTKSLARNNIITNYEYDDLNRRISYNNSKGDTVLSTYQYEYDGEDNIISETVNGVVNTYEYNELDELKTSIKSIDGIAVTTEYKYDIYGNKIESSSDGTSKVYRYNDKNQLVNIKSAEGLTDIYYDQNGNIRDIYYAGGYKEYYQYDEFGQLVTLKTNKDRTYSYEYDAQGDRINEKKTVENRYAVDYEKDSKEWYDYIQTLPFDEVKELLEEKDSHESFDAMRYQLTYRKKTGLCASNLVQDPKSNEKCTETAYTLDKTVENALIISTNDDFSIYGEERIETISEDESILYLSGLNQSVMDTVTATPKKETVSHIEYDDFGNSTDIKDGFGYDGEKLDVTGNIYLRARYYNPRIGQFVQIDAYRGTQEDITSQNRYTYCLNNQYKYTDPSGHIGILGVLLGYEATKYLVAGGIMLIGAYLLTPSGKKAAKKGMKALYDLAKKVQDATKNKNKNKKSTANKAVSITTPIVSAGAVSIPKPNIDVAIPVLQPCPWDAEPSMNNLPDSIISLISSIGFTFVVKEMYKRIKINKQYRWSKENHHMVPKDANCEVYVNGEEATLVKARASLSNAGVDARTDRRNIVRIHTAIHRTTTNGVYNGGIAVVFYEAKYSEVLTKSRTLRVIFRAIDDSLFPFDRVEKSHIYY